MEYNFLLFTDKKLAIKDKENFLPLEQENINKLSLEYCIISDFMDSKYILTTEIVKLLKSNQIVVSFVKVSSALKEIQDNKIINHLNRDNFRRIAFPIFVKSKFLKEYLKNNQFKFDLNAFLQDAKFQGIELDS